MESSDNVPPFSALKAGVMAQRQGLAASVRAPVGNGEQLYAIAL
jgi:hypothetical protein